MHLPAAQSAGDAADMCFSDLATAHRIFLPFRLISDSFAANPLQLQLCSGVMDVAFVHANYSWNESHLSKILVDGNMRGLCGTLLTCVAVEQRQKESPVDLLLWISCAACYVLFWCKL
jgi:hypothetical protein